MGRDTKGSIVYKYLSPNFILDFRKNERTMSFDYYTQHMPTLQRTTFWSNYMSGIKGNLSVTDPEVVIQQPSLFSQYRPVDVTMYDLIYGSHRASTPSRSGYEFYRPLHTDIYGRSRARTMY